MAKTWLRSIPGLILMGLLGIVFGLLVMTACRSLFGQTPQPPQATVDDLYRAIGVCQVTNDIKDKYIQQLQTTIALLQKQQAQKPEKPVDKTAP